MFRVASMMGCLLLVGCDLLWDAANRSTLTSDVRELLKMAEALPQQLDCHMVGSTRNAACALRLSQSEVASVIRTFALVRVDPSPVSPSPFAGLPVHLGPSCVAGSNAPRVAFGVSGRPMHLRLRSGSAFEYLLLTLDPSTGQTCVQVAYASG